MRKMKNVYKILVGKLQGKRPFKYLDIDERLY
jgi:hypothetical protein